MDLVPILDNTSALSLEKRRLKDTESEYFAMKHVGEKIAHEILSDFRELKPVPENLSVLALVGKGKNGGDCLLTCDYLMRALPRAKVYVVLLSAESTLDPLCKKAFKEVEQRCRVHVMGEDFDQESFLKVLDAMVAEYGSINLCLDGLYGLGFRLPLETSVAQLLESVNAYDEIDVRASVDIPSGLSQGDETCFFRSDFSYMAGTAKQVFFSLNAAIGRVRFIDIGLYDEQVLLENEGREHYLCPTYLKQLSCLRPSNVEKRSFGHLFILGGSQFMPGALLMTVQAAIQSGVGLVTVFAPGSIVPTLSAQVPEAIWIALPETVVGSINTNASDIILEMIASATAIVLGPGLGSNRETEFVVQQLINRANIPIVLDADALMPRVLESIHKRKSIGSNQIILTPHMGEFLRMFKLSRVNLGTKAFLSLIKTMDVTVVLKGAITRICDGEQLLLSSRGGPVLSRGGSGDMLAGIIGSRIAQKNIDLLAAAALGVLIHGCAAELLAREQGQTFVRTTDLLKYLPKVLR